VSEWVPFVKAHACGNDFLVIEEAEARGRHAAMARALCARNSSIGADGIEFVERRGEREFFLRLFNSDGSEAELSGNGTRCVAAWLAEKDGLNDVLLSTHGGVRHCVVKEQKDAAWWIESAMGVPRVMPRSIEIEGIGAALEGVMVNVGNPHFVLFPEAEDFSIDGQSWQQIGAKIAVDRMFPHGTNVEFVRLLGEAEIAFRIFERGCGPTMSSGTGTCASSAAAMEMRGVARALTAMAEGGVQQVRWPDRTAEMMLTGPAVIAGKGVVRF
jgi:diaminopimelate epimerase